MKKILLLLSFFLLPFNTLAYSEYIIPGGQTLGIKVETNGIMIIGFYKINGKYNKGTKPLSSGDYIIKINDINIDNIDTMTQIIEENIDKSEIEITFLRNKKEYKTKLPLIYSEGKYKTGLYVKDSIKGIGTLSYIDPETRIFGALGHEIEESTTHSIVEIKSGDIFRNMITGIDKSRPGSAGSKLANFDYEYKYGNITKNTNLGIFGIYNHDYPVSEKLKVSEDIKIGKAYFQTVLSGEKIDKYDIEITSINKDSKIKNITFKITDEKLIDKTGGIVQGMSGSPIIQGDAIVGVITHVILDNPISGYGILITNMLEEGER